MNLNKNFAAVSPLTINFPYLLDLHPTINVFGARDNCLYHIRHEL